MKTPLYIPLLALFAAQTFVSAAVITIPNYSFELPALASGGTSYGTPTSWTVTQNVTGTNRTFNNSIKNPAVTPVGVDGTQFTAIYLDNNDNDPLTPNLDLSAQLSSANLGTLTSATIYSLTAAFGGSNNGSPRTYGLAILANGVSVAQELFNTNTLPGDGSFLDKTITLDTTSQASLVGQTLSVQLLYNSTYDYGRELFMDNVRLTAVPEPSSVALLLGAVSMGFVLYRRRK